DLSQVTSPPDRNVSVIASPASRCPFTESVRPEVRKTISAEASDAPANKTATVAAATRTVLGTSIGTLDRHTWLGRCPQKGTAELRCCTAAEGGLLSVDIDVENANPQLTWIGASWSKRLIDVKHQIHHIARAEL